MECRWSLKTLFHFSADVVVPILMQFVAMLGISELMSQVRLEKKSIWILQRQVKFTG